MKFMWKIERSVPVRGIGSGRSLLVLALLLVVFVSGCGNPEERAAAYLAKAEQLFSAGNLIKARLEVKNALQIKPRYPDARFLLARIEEARQDYREMARQLSAAIKSKPEFLEARLKLGTLYVHAKALDLADEQYREALLIDPDNAGVRVLHARLLASRSDLDGARAELEAALKADPANTQAIQGLAGIIAATDPVAAIAMVDKGIASAQDPAALRVLKLQLLQGVGDTAALIEEFESLIVDYPQQKAFRYQFVRVLSASGRMDQAQQVLKDIVAADPDDDQAKLALVQFVSKTGTSEEAEALLIGYADAESDKYPLRLALGRLYQATGQLDKATRQYEFVAGEAGDSGEALTAKTRLARIRLSAGDSDAAEALLDEILAVDPGNASALLFKGALEFDREKYTEAISNLRTLLRNEPKNYRAQLILARAHLRNTDLPLAKEAYLRAIEINRAEGRASLELSRLLVKEGQRDQAEKLLRSLLEVSPDNTNGSRALIALLVSRERYTQAQAEARRLAALPEREAVGDNLLGTIYQVRDQHEQAVTAFDRSLKQQPGAREPLQRVVVSLLRLQRNDEAVARLEKIIAESPDNLFAQTLLSQVLAGAGDTVGARNLLESALDANQEWLPAYTTLASLQGDDVDAQIDVYKRGLEAMPDSRELVLLLGVAYERAGKVEEAIAAYEQVLAADPNQLAVTNNLAALLADNRTDKASWDRALELAQRLEGNKNPAFIDTLGWAHYRLGNLDTAVRLLEEAVSGAEQVPVLRYHLGMAYLAQGKPGLAREQLQVAAADTVADYAGLQDARDALASIDAQ